MPLHVRVISQEGMLFEEHAADSVIIPAAEGEMGVLPRHAAIVATLGYGELRVRKGGAEESFAVYGGVVDVRNDNVIVLADTAETTSALDESKAAEARIAAEKAMREGVPADKAATILADLRRASVQEGLAKKMKQRGPVARIRSLPDDGSKR
jgi:F-type H+-transporting ATPase subunit epsilon